MKTHKQIESELESELGWRWTEQMRHGFKTKKLWDKLVASRTTLDAIDSILSRNLTAGNKILNIQNLLSHKPLDSENGCG
jgi:hypothetical protein